MSVAVDHAFLRTYTFEQGDRESLSALTSRARSNPYANFNAFSEEVEGLSCELPRPVAELFDGLAGRTYKGCVLLRGLPIPEDLPLTPLQPFAKTGLQMLGTEALLIFIGARIAQPFSYREWDAGHMVHNKYPIESHKQVQFGSNAVEFLIHTETPFREISPDYVCLLCLRGDPQKRAQTRLCDLASASKDLAPDEISLLHQPCYSFITDNPAIVARGLTLTPPMPILKNRDGKLVYEYVHDLVAINDDAQTALDKLKKSVEVRSIGICLEAGDLLIIDNSHVVHGRTAYHPRYDGTDRWLQRLLLSARLFGTTEKPLDRFVSDRRLEHYPSEYLKVLRGLGPAEAVNISSTTG